MAWNNSKPFKSPSSTPEIELDPQAPGTTIRRAFAFEAALNLFTLPLIISPASVLSLLVAHPSQITPLAEILARLLGGLIVGGLTPALLFGLPNSRAGIESRRTIYLILGLGEVALIPLLVLEALKGGSGEAVAFAPRTAWMMVGNLVPPFAWRVWCLYFRPEIFGRYREVVKEE